MTREKQTLSPFPACSPAGQETCQQLGSATGNAVQQHDQRPQAAELPEAAPPAASHQKALSKSIQAHSTCKGQQERPWGGL